MKNYITKIVTFAILITTIISCKVSKDIETPKDAFPENFRNASVSSDTTSIADIEWKNLFTEKDIVQLIDSAAGLQVRIDTDGRTGPAGAVLDGCLSFFSMASGSCWASASQPLQHRNTVLFKNVARLVFKKIQCDSISM